MIIKYSPAFLDKLKKVDVRIKNSFKKKILIFIKDPHYPQLNNHALKREFQGYRSIDITSNYRAIYQEKEELADQEVVYFILLGTHKELYC